MKARYENDRVRGPGYGFLLVSDVRDTADLEGLTIGIKRASDQKSLGQSGWQRTEGYLALEGVSLTDDGFALAVGPAVVDRLDPREIYRLSLRQAGGGMETGSLSVPEVAYSPLEGGQGIGALTPPEPPAVPTLPPAPEPEKVEPGPEPPPEPLEPAPGTLEPPSDEAEAAPEMLVPAPEAASPLPPPRTDAPGRRTTLPLVAVVLVLVLAAAGAAAWTFLRDAENVPPAAPVTPTAKEEPENGLSRARKLLAANPKPEEILTLAEELRREAARTPATGGKAETDQANVPGGADAAFLLYEDAAQKGNAEAMFQVAQYYNPAVSESRGSIVPDPSQALFWYLKAAEAGHGQARAALGPLKEWAKKQADQGSAEAAQLLDRFPD